METVTRTPSSGVGVASCALTVGRARRGQVRLKSRENTGRVYGGRKRGQTRIIFVDRWYGRWLKVGGSGLKWNAYPLAHGRQFSAPKILRRRVPSFPRRKEPDHHPFPMAP